ncbi:MAG: hypothetical protein Satyrvirus3_33 [Satyrvirus sp.]|uniref:Uncharacterized protein n=1 Tax=Satyrvirus sp. TaxID=2487771 RepID=A0A3G5AD55_9VIRU|nr:MAG: hypothetical protein Satyrvirus3_33 [Satyrvirus sp.]
MKMDDNLNDIIERIKKIKLQLDNLSTDEEDYGNSNNFGIDDIKYFDCINISEQEEIDVTKWDLCAKIKKNGHKNFGHECGKFVVNEDLNVFKKKVIHKTEIIVACYKKKIIICDENKCNLQKKLEDNKYKMDKLQKQLAEYYRILESYNKNKISLLKTIIRLEKKIQKYGMANTNIEYHIRKFSEEINKLVTEVRMLICCNKELSKENIDLKIQLGKNLKILKYMCDKYSSLVLHPKFMPENKLCDKTQKYSDFRPTKSVKQPKISYLSNQI